MVAQHPELKTFSHLQAMKELVNKLKTTDKKEIINNSTKRLEDFYEKATNKMDVIKDIAEKIKTPKWTKEVDHTSNNILNNNIKPMLNAINYLLKDEKKRDKFQLEIDKLGSNSSNATDYTIAKKRDEKKDEIITNLKKFLDEICAIITESDVIKEKLDKKRTSS